MRKLAFALLIAAALPMTARMFTGIYYRIDDALAYFVLKPVPDFTIERVRTDGEVFDRVTVLDDDEFDLAYGALYRGSMSAAPYAALAMAGTGVVLLRLRKTSRNAHRRRSASVQS